MEGDAHAGATVQHRSRDPEAPNLRQVHLLHHELLDELALAPGQVGENITTRGVDLLSLPRGTLLHLGQEAVVELTGLRNPCRQLDGLRPGLMQAMLDRDAAGNLVRKCGVMAVVRAGGVLYPGDGIRILLPEPPYQRLQPV
ncbi:MAG: hypothetical protein AMXMBFR33_30020 [Candidatus Xenobia bacterium]